MLDFSGSRKLNETKIGYFLIAILASIILTSAIGGFLQVQEIRKQAYFLELAAQRNEDFADLKISKRR